jgi:hypothetical protein
MIPDQSSSIGLNNEKKYIVIVYLFIITMSSWRKYGGKNIVTNDTINVGTVVANQFLTRTTLSTTNTFDNINVLGEAIVHYNSYLKKDVFVGRNEFISNNLYVKNKIMLGIDVSNNINPYAYIAGEQYNIGINTMNPSTVFHITGSNTNILTIDTKSAIIRNIIGENVNKKGIVIEAEDKYSNIYFYNDSSTDVDNIANGYLRYQTGGYLTLSTQTAIDLSAAFITSHFGNGIMHFDEANSLINTPGNLLFNSQNVFVNSTNNFLFAYSPNGPPSSAVLLNTTGIVLNTTDSFYMNSPGGKISSTYSNNNGKVTISTNITEISSNIVMSTSGVYNSKYGETLTVYDSSNSIYLFNMYDSSASRTGNAITMVATDNSSNTQAKIIAPNNMGLSLIGGVFPNDTSRSMGTISLTDISQNLIQSHTILSGKDPAKYFSTFGINTYRPKTERYILDINGPTRIGNGEINTMANPDFEIKIMKFSKIDPLSGIAVGTPIINYNQIILYTKDGGITWKSSVLYGLVGLNVDSTITSLYVYDKNFAMIGSIQNKLFYTYNGGYTWNAINYDSINSYGMSIEDAKFDANNLRISGYYNRVTTSIAIKKIGTYYYIYTGYSYTNSAYTEKYNKKYIFCHIVQASLFTVNQQVDFQYIDPAEIPFTVNDSCCGNNYAYFVGTFIYILIISNGISNSFYNPKNSIYNSVFVYDDDNIIAVGNNVISWTTNGSSKASNGSIISTWSHTDTSIKLGNMNLRNVFIFDLFNAVAVGDNGVFIYTNNWSVSNTWKIVPPELLNSSGIADRITSANLRGIHMYDINSFIIANVNQSYNLTSKQLGQSQIMYCYFPNIFNRVNNNIFDVSGNMIISGDININDSGQIFSNNPTFNILNNNIVKEIYLGSNTANTAINGNLYIGNDISLNSRLFVYGDASYNSNFGILGNITIFRNQTIYSNNYDISTVFMPSSTMTIGYNAMNINIGSNPYGGKTITIGTGSPSILLGPTVKNNIYIGAPNDDTILYGNTQIRNVTQTQFMIPLLQLNMAQSDIGITNSGTKSIEKGNVDAGAGISIKDLSNNFAGYMLVSNDTSGYYFKAPGPDNVVNLNIGKLQWPPGFPTQLNISNNIQNGILVLSKDVDVQNNASYGITVKPIDISNVFLRDGTATSTNTYQQITTNVGVSGDLTVMLNNRLFVYCDTSLNSRLLVYSDVSFSRRLFVSGDVSMNSNLYIANSLCIDTSGNQSLYNLDVSGTNNFRGPVNAINLIDNSVIMSNTPAIDFSNNFCIKWMQNVIAPVKLWKSIAMSANGLFQTAVINNGRIYNSYDYGVNWSLNLSSNDNLNWTSVAMTANGQIQVAVTSTKLYISIDYGNTWILNTFNPSTSFLLTSISISSNGQFISIVGYSGTSADIYTSSNSGTSFLLSKNISNIDINTDTDSNNCSTSISSTGQYQVCCFNVNNTSGNNINSTYISNNYGQAWTAKNLPYTDYLSCSCISSSGQYICIGRLTLNNTYGLFISNNYGDSFVSTGPQSSSINNYKWGCVSMSANGQYIVTVSLTTNNLNGMISSVDYGKTWNIGTAPSSAWNCVKMSANGQYITAVVKNGYIYNSVTPYINVSISNNLIVYRDVSFNARVFIGGPTFQF